MSRLLAATTLFCVACCAACSAAPSTRAPGLPPTPKSITNENPGGDAADPEGAALGRLFNEAWGWKRDPFDTLRIPLTDWTKWQQAKIWGHPTRASFRFGDDHYAVIGLWYGPSEAPSDPASCLARFVADTLPQAEAYGVRFGEAKDLAREQTVRGERRPIVVKIVEGTLETLLGASSYVGGIASYSSWPGTCLIEGFAVSATKHRELALRIRERWLDEGVVRLQWEKKIIEAPPALSR